MMKPSSIANLVPFLLVLVALQVHGFVPFDFESEFPQDSTASEFSYEPEFLESGFIRDFPETQYFPKNDEAASLFSESGSVPQDSLETQNFPEKSYQSLEYGSEYPIESFETEQVPYEIDARRKIKSPSPSPSEVPSPSPSEAPSPLPSPLPSPSEAPSPSPSDAPSPSPSIPENTCKYKCSMKCHKVKFPLLRELCNHLCKTKCLLRYTELVYKCTSLCADSMPGIFKSDKKKAAGYVDYCYKMCSKKFYTLPI